MAEKEMLNTSIEEFSRVQDWMELSGNPASQSICAWLYTAGFLKPQFLQKYCLLILPQLPNLLLNLSAEVAFLICS